jgi:shikimate kinase
VGTLWLVGMMGSGKTTVGRAVACRLGITYIDLDEEIVAATGTTIPEMFAGAGEESFRDAEAAAVEAVAGRAAVVATGGGAVLRARSRRIMRGNGLVVWLDAAATELAARLGAGEGRPLLADGEPASRVADLLAEREPAYRAAAHHRVDTTGRGAGDVAGEVIALWTRS